MALVVEDGSGVVGAESYASLTDATDYWAKRVQSPLAQAWSAQTTTDPQREGALREASGYLDTIWGPKFTGVQASTSQGLKWPRHILVPDPTCTLPLYRHYGLARPMGWRFPLDAFLFVPTVGCDVDTTIVYGSDGVQLAALPSQIVVATIELAARALTQPLAQDYQNGQRLKSESAGDTEFVYFDDGRAQASFGVIAQLLEPVLAAAGESGWSWA